MQRVHLEIQKSTTLCHLGDRNLASQECLGVKRTHLQCCGLILILIFGETRTVPRKGEQADFSHIPHSSVLHASPRRRGRAGGKRWAMGNTEGHAVQAHDPCGHRGHIFTWRAFFGRRLHPPPLCSKENLGDETAQTQPPATTQFTKTHPPIPSPGAACQAAVQ